MSFLKRFAQGAVGAAADYTEGLVANKLEAQRRERLASINSEYAQKEREADAAFKDSRYEMESTRELETYRKKREIERDTAPVKIDKDKSSWDEFELGTNETGDKIIGLKKDGVIIDPRTEIGRFVFKNLGRRKVDDLVDIFNSRADIERANRVGGESTSTKPSPTETTTTDDAGGVLSQVLDSTANRRASGQMAEQTPKEVKDDFFAQLETANVEQARKLLEQTEPFLNFVDVQKAKMIIAAKSPTRSRSNALR